MVAIKGHFDGTVIIPDEPVDLPRNTRVTIHVEGTESQGIPGGNLLKFAGTIDPEQLREMTNAIRDGCERIDNEW